MLVQTFFLCIIAEFSAGYKFLAFLPFPAKSHQNAFTPLLHELAKKGHQVDYVTSVEPQFSHPNLKLMLIKPFINIFKEEMNLIKLGQVPKAYVPYMMSSTAETLASCFYGDPVAQAVIHSSQAYDAVIMESFFLQEPVSALIHKLGCPAIEVSSLGDSAWINELSGLPDNPAYQVDFKSRLTDSMTFWERLYNSYVSWTTVAVSYYHLWRMQRVMDKYFNYTGWEDRPPIQQLISNKSMILINREETVATYPYPSAPHVRSIGGLNIITNKQLPTTLKSFMDEAKNGVIFFSFGSNLKTSGMVQERMGDEFIKVFAQMEQKVLMKWETDFPGELPPNIRISDWFPQQDILAHENCAVFITHGGYLSLTESVYHGVPLLGIPFFGDQFKNLKQVETAGYGLVLDVDNVTANTLFWALKQLIYNPKYKAEAVKRSTRMRDRRHTAIEDAVYWVEYAVKYPNALTPASAKLTFIQLHMIDIYAFIAISIITIPLLSCKLFRFIIHMRYSLKNKKYKHL